MPVEITSVGPPETPEDVPPQGYVDASNNPAEPPLQHRPHPFALQYGDGGAKVAYGQLFWQIDSFNFDFNVDGDASIHNVAVGQQAIPEPTAVVPTIDADTGDAMGKNTPNVYHQLDGFGDVYLYWHVELYESERVSSCWVEVGGAISASNIAAVALGHLAHDRFNSIGLGIGEGSGFYRVQLGTVTEGASIQQHISSDVYWSTFVLVRS